MPEISRFFGIIIKLYFGDHSPPHFHVEYGEYNAIVSIHTLTMIYGKLPPRVLGMVLEWAVMHQSELQELWERAVHEQPLYKIAPLE